MLALMARAGMETPRTAGEVVEKSSGKVVRMSIRTGEGKASGKRNSPRRRGERGEEQEGEGLKG